MQNKIYNIYFSHSMEGFRSLEESGVRGLLLRHKLGKRFNVWLPEEHQADWAKQKQVDLDAEFSSDILLVDMFQIGTTVDDRSILGQGTNAELGFMFACNKLRTKKVPIILIMPKKKHYHCFRKPDNWQKYGVSKITYSLEEAANYIKRNYK